MLVEREWKHDDTTSDVYDVVTDGLVRAARDHGGVKVSGEFEQCVELRVDGRNFRVVLQEVL